MGCADAASTSLVYRVIIIIIITSGIEILLFPLAVDQIGVHGIIDIVDTDVPDAHAVFGLLVEVDAQVQAMAGGKTVVVTSGDVRGGFYTTFGTYDDGFPFGHGDASAGVEYPRSA